MPCCSLGPDGSAPTLGVRLAGEFSTALLWCSVPKLEADPKGVG